MIILLMMFTMLESVFGHGYLVYPLARQRFCYNQQDYYWPTDGTGIANSGCRKAFQHIYNKNKQNSAMAQAMFNQNTEYAAVAGADYRNATHIKRNVVPHTLCGAGADSYDHRFGDKSGMDIATNEWFVNTMTYQLATDLYFCPTAIHEPSYFEVYVSKKEYDPNEAALLWSDLTLIHRNVSKIVQKQLTNCESNRVYEINNVQLPYRSGAFVIYVRWQREDIVGEGFYNCADVIFNHDEL
nr:GP37 [Pieris rapae granulovirus]